MGLWVLGHPLLLVALATLAHLASQCQEVHEALEVLVGLGFPWARFPLWVLFRLWPQAFPWLQASLAFRAYLAFQLLDIPVALVFL